MVLSLLALGLIVGLKVRIMPNGHSGRQPESMAQIRRPPLAHMGLGSLELPGLVDGGINASIGDELVSALKTMDIADLAQDGSAGGQANSWDGGDVLRDLVHQFGQGSIKMCNLLVKKVDLLEQAAHLDTYSIDQEAYADRPASRVLNGFGLGLTKVPATSIAEQESQLGQVKVSDFLG
jgi:hypothetical protein